MLKTILLVLQIAVPALLIVCILVQQRGTALGSSFGGGESGGFYMKKRGIEKKIFWASIVLAALFIIISLLNLLFIK